MPQKKNFAKLKILVLKLKSIVSYLQNPEKILGMIERLRSYGVQLEKGENTTEVLSTVLEGKTFLLLGNFHFYA